MIQTPTLVIVQYSLQDIHIVKPLLILQDSLLQKKEIIAHRTKKKNYKKIETGNCS